MKIKKRILICDDEQDQFDTLNNNLQDSYEIIRSYHYESVLNDLNDHAPIHLLILDLGFGDEGYVGQQILPKLQRDFPNLKVIVYSSILTDIGHDDQAKEVSEYLLRFHQVKAFLSSDDSRYKLKFAVGRVLGSPDWLSPEDPQLWILHISDPQFGGKGIDISPSDLAKKIISTVQSFQTREPENGEPTKKSYPFITIMTGDLTETGKPIEYLQASEFLQELSSTMNQLCQEMQGLVEPHNTIIIPGNHDINWDISRGQNIQVNADMCVYDGTTEKRRSELEFIQKYAWMPFIELPFGKLEDKEWIWNPGYKLINLINELNIVFVCLNTSKWGVNHLEQNGIVPDIVWDKIQKDLTTIDPDRNTLRVLLSHHTLDQREEKKNQLILRLGDIYNEDLIDIISRRCNFGLVLTGHVHDFLNGYIETGSTKRKLVHLGAGTIARDAIRKYKNPQFTIIQITKVNDISNKFEELYVYPYSYDSPNFIKYATFEDGQQSWGKYDLIY